jgi:predicted alpha/beta hydrolase
VAHGYHKGRGELSDSGEGKQLRLRAADGVEIGAVFYAALRPRSPRRVAVLHGGAGIPALRYGRFARFLAEWGIPVLTYDYRGIGLSRPRELRGFEATIEDWAELDSAGAIAWLRERFPQDEILGISHSIGALMLGGAPNAAEQARIVLVGAHTGYYGDYSALYRLPMAVAWHGMMPAVTRFFGYFPAGRLGLGDDLPAGMALEWAERRRPDLRLSGPEPAEERRRQLLDRCAALFPAYRRLSMSRSRPPMRRCGASAISASSGARPGWRCGRSCSRSSTRSRRKPLSRPWRAARPRARARLESGRRRRAPAPCGAPARGPACSSSSARDRPAASPRRPTG